MQECVHPDDRNAAALFQHPDSRRKNGHIAPEFIDDKSLYAIPFFRLQKLYCPVKLGENPAPVNIPGKQHRCIYHGSQSHVYNII